MMKTLQLCLIIGVAYFLAACGTTQGNTLPSTGYILPNTTVNVAPGYAYTVQQIAVAAATVAVLNYVYDPLAPNWSIQEKMLNENTYYLALKAKSFRVGGDGESYQIIKRRALQLQREKGYASYQILDYTEGIESSTPLTNRVSEGTIQLVSVLPSTSKAVSSFMPPPPRASGVPANKN